MWDGVYGFFDYKYNIEGYSGQDYDGMGRFVYMIGSLVLITLLLIIFRNTKKENVTKYLRVMAIFVAFLEIVKPVWESYWDITTGRGFNFEGLLPLYTCSMFTYALLFVAFSRGNVQEFCAKWVCTIGFVGGMSNILFIQGLKWYPFFTFGASYSMVFHFIMVFTALFLVVTRYVEFHPSDGGKAMIPHLIFSAIVIPIDHIFGWDYMQYYDAGGVPLIEDLADTFSAAGCGFLTTIVMLALYALLAYGFASIYALAQGNVGRKHQAHAAEEALPKTTQAAQ